MVFGQIWSDHPPARFRKVEKDFEKKLDFKDVSFPAKIGDVIKIEKKL